MSVRPVRCGRSSWCRSEADAKVAIYALPGDGGGLLAAHARAARRGSFVVDEAHWDGLPDGHTRAVTAGGAVLPRQHQASPAPRGTGARAGALEMLLASRPAANAPVARRPLSDYQQAILPAMPPAGG